MIAVDADVNASVTTCGVRGLEPTGDPAPLEILANLVHMVPRSLVSGLLMLLDQLTLRSKQRAEYLADSLAARAGSTEAAVGLLDRLLVAEPVRITLRRENNRLRALPRRAGRSEGLQDGLREVLAAHTESIPEHEYERQRRVGARRGHGVDDTHPPTHLCRECLLVGAPAPAAVVADADCEQRIAAELADARGQVARQIVRDGFDG
ncbi:hypothetical protein OG524_25560 [Streptomyces sp. NBC_01520]|uniref:hypothetical protein n=1 Tax=Streptomyces sp. NBC_01520 TaxID=2903892 RepID=UPI003865EB98